MNTYAKCLKKLSLKELETHEGMESIPPWQEYGIDERVAKQSFHMALRLARMDLVPVGAIISRKVKAQVDRACIKENRNLTYAIEAGLKLWASSVKR